MIPRPDHYPSRYTWVRWLSSHGLQCQMEGRVRMGIRRGKLARSRREPEGKSHDLVSKLVSLVHPLLTYLNKTKKLATNTKNASSDQVNCEEPQHIEVPPHLDILDF